MNKNENPFKPRVIRILLVVLFIIGIAMAFNNLIRIESSMLTEHDNHLIDLANTADNNISIILNYSQMEMESMVKEQSFTMSEQRYVNYRDETWIKRSLSEAPVCLSPFAERVIAVDDDNAFLSSYAKDKLNYSFIKGEGEDNIEIVHDNSSGKDYLGIYIYSDAGYKYELLTDIEQFFQSVIVNSIYEEYWTVLYDHETGLILQNDNSSPIYFFSERDEMLSNNDGYSEIIKSEDYGEAAITKYTFSKEDAFSESRMYTIPCSASLNGRFSIGIAVYNNDILLPIQTRLIYTVLSFLIIAFSVAFFIYYFMHRRRETEEKERELQNLEKEHELTASLLKQQEEMIHHQKLETIGTLTAGIAHEFNNMLSPIMGDSLLILENLSPDDEFIYDNALEIYNASTKAKEIVSKITRLSRKSSQTQMKPISAKELIEGTISVTSSIVPKNISVISDIRTNKLVMGHETDLGHLLLNLFINAIQAMEDLKSTEGKIILSAWDAKGTVFLSVSDTGKGLPEEHLDELFEPFFTTKETGKGTGLGLAIAQRTANNHGGSITAENNLFGGARFILSLPEYVPDEEEAGE